MGLRALKAFQNPAAMLRQHSGIQFWSLLQKYFPAASVFKMLSTLVFFHCLLNVGTEEWRENQSLAISNKDNRTLFPNWTTPNLVENQPNFMKTGTKIKVTGGNPTRISPPSTSTLFHVMYPMNPSVTMSDNVTRVHGRQLFSFMDQFENYWNEPVPTGQGRDPYSKIPDAKSVDATPEYYFPINTWEKELLAEIDNGKAAHRESVQYQWPIHVNGYTYDSRSPLQHQDTLHYITPAHETYSPQMPQYETTTPPNDFYASATQNEHDHYGHQLKHQGYGHGKKHQGGYEHIPSYESQYYGWEMPSYEKKHHGYGHMPSYEKKHYGWEMPSYEKKNHGYGHMPSYGKVNRKDLF